MKPFESSNTNSVEKMASAAGERAKDYVDTGVHALKAVSGKARQVGHDADGYVRENPWLVMGVAAGVGLLIGFLMRGRRAA